MTELGNRLKSAYANAEACDKETGKCYKGETDLVAMFGNLSTSYDRLTWAWKAWADATKPEKSDYIKFVDVMNIGARDNGECHLNLRINFLFQLNREHVGYSI